MNDAEKLEEEGWRQRGLDAGRVFTPTSPVDEKSLFAGRNEQIHAIVDVIRQKGQHAIIYGERGVGKTSLVNVLASFLGVPGLLAPRVNCDSTDTFETVWKKVFEQIELTRARAEIGFTRQLSVIKFNMNDYFPDGVSPDSVRRALTLLGDLPTVTIVIIDEFDRLAIEQRKPFADTIKSLSDHGIHGTVVLVGVADSVSELLAEHASVERALAQIQMPRMSSVEIRQIITTGAAKLGMTVSAAALRQVAKLAQGLPHYAHLIGLHAVRAAVDTRSTEIGVGAVREAIDRSIRAANQSIRTAYDLAIRSARKDNLFADVLLSCALAETNDLGFFAAHQVRGPMKMVTGKSYEIPSFAQHLNEFCDAKRGPILQKSGSRRLYRYRFINPLMQPFVIMQGIQSCRISSEILD